MEWIDDQQQLRNTVTRGNWYEALEQLTFAIAYQISDSIDPRMRRLADIAPTLFCMHSGRAGSIARMILGNDNQ